MLDDQAPGSEEAEASSGQLAQASLPTLNMDGLSYEEYSMKVEEMVELMRQHWRREQRVKTLKVVIQLTKLLADTSQMKLYPRKFKLITDCLDEFGRLIYVRVHSIAMASSESKQGTSGGNNTDRSSNRRHSSGQVDSRELAKDICRNWFLKVASIRELVPRFYIELAILKACDILFSATSKLLADSIEEQFFAQTLRRLTRTAWGFGDPIVALHARAYLCRVAERLIGWNGPTRDAILFELTSSNLRCGATLINRLDTISIVGARVRRTTAATAAGSITSSSPPSASPSSPPQSSEISTYFDLVSSPIQSILSVVTIRCDVYAEEPEFVANANWRLKRVANDLLEAEQAPGTHDVLRRNIIFHSLFKALPNDIVASMAGQFNEKFAEDYARLAREGAEIATAERGNQGVVDPRVWEIPTVYATLTSFIIALDGSESFELDSDVALKRSILSTCDGLLNKLLKCEFNRLSVAYLRCFKAILSYANHYLDESVDNLLTEFVNEIKRGRQYVSHYATLMDIIKTLFTNRTRVDEFKRIFNSRSFCQLLELLRKDEHKLEASRWILETMRANIKLNHKGEIVTITDRALINFLLKLFGSINDSLSPLTGTDDIRHLSDLVIFFMNTIAIDDILERLELYSRCRNVVGNLNFVLEHLVRVVLDLVEEHRKVEKRRSARQNFLNGCLAFAFATTPAVVGQLIQLELYQRGCELALAHMSLSLADYFVKQIMGHLRDTLGPAEQQQQRESDEAGQRDRMDDNLPGQGQLNVEGGKRRQSAPVKRSRPAHNAALTSRLNELLRMVVKHQEHVDLKQKLTLASLVEDCAKLDESSSLEDLLKQLNYPAAAAADSSEGHLNNAVDFNEPRDTTNTNGRSEQKPALLSPLEIAL